MQRFPVLIELYKKVQASDIKVVFVQINEAHSTKWPLGLTDHPEVHCDLKDRLERAQRFVEDYKFPYPVYVDQWTDDFENSYHAWPDQYSLIDCKTGKIMTHSKYSEDAMVTNDYAKLLMELLQ